MDAVIPLNHTEETDSPPATFGTASLVFAALTVLLPAVAMLLFGEKAAREERAGPWGGLASLGVLLAGVFFSSVMAGLSSVAGTVTGAVALIRDEANSWRAVVGMMLCVPVALFLGFATALAMLNRN